VPTDTVEWPQPQPLLAATAALGAAEALAPPELPPLLLDDEELDELPELLLDDDEEAVWLLPEVPSL
jgi:hypothetical protein